MEHPESKQCLLSDRDDVSEELFEQDFRITAGHRPWVARHRNNCVLAGLLILSIGLNVAQSLEWTWLKHKPYLGLSPYSGLAYETPVVYHAHTDYWGQNETLADELWDSLNTDPVGISLTDSYVEKHGLPVSARFPWDDSRGIYFVKAFHHLHCLKLIRRAFVNNQRGNIQDVMDDHVHHCLDALRQDVMCTADDTPMPVTAVSHSLGNGQVMQCRNWDELVEWTQAPEQNACFKLLGDYHTVKHTLERHQFCPPDSPYREIADRYFEKFGHKDS